MEREEMLTIKKFIHKLKRNWYWFFVACMIGGALGYLHHQMKPPSYQLDSLYLVKSDDNSDLNMSSIFPSGMGKNINLQNHIGILTSYSINKKVISNLNWRTSWYKQLMFRDEEIYDDEPFDVIFDDNAVNLKGVPIHIEMLDSAAYRVQVDDKVQVYGREVELNLNEKGNVGEPFSSEYFHFTLYPKNVRIGDSYYFKFNSMDGLVESYVNRLNVAAVDPDADLIKISIIDNVPQKAADYLNELSDVYINYELSEKNHKSATTINFIDSQLRDVIDTLKVAGNNFTSFRSKNQIVDMSQEGGIIMKQLVDLDSERSSVQAHLDYYKNLQKYLDNTEKMKQVVAPSVVGIVDNSLNDLVVHLSDLYRQRGVISYTAHAKNPKLILINNEIDLVKRNLKENLKNLINNAVVQVQGLDRRIAKVNKQLSAYPKTEQAMINMKRMYDLNNDLYTFLLKKRAEAAITQASNVADTKILDRARPQLAETIGAGFIVNVGGGIAGGFMIPLMVILLANYFYDRIKSAEDIEEFSEISVIGNIVTASSGSEHLAAIDNPRSAVAESFRELRTNLQFISPKNSKNSSIIIGVNSVIPGEGKSFTAANLASMIAINNKKVLLIDCDLRKPSLHNRLKYKNMEGLSNYLTDFCSFEDVVRHTRVENLHFISAGPIPPNPSELLENKNFEVLLKQCREMYDYIVFDNPPLSLVSDGVVIGQKVDINLFVTRQDFSKKSEVRFIDHVHEKKSMKNAGIILNDINLSKHAHVGSYGAEYGYKKKNSNYYFESSPSYTG
ncbi:MAG TPA: polysaccharide biosynthesis tyrosine autokinase [Sunxiuqinia sp.]|nr:polysaccharide biosynthesis tyrosine autokinase [Sunxiuqinia sp.]